MPRNFFSLSASLHRGRGDFLCFSHARREEISGNFMFLRNAFFTKKCVTKHFCVIFCQNLCFWKTMIFFIKSAWKTFFVVFESPKMETFFVATTWTVGSRNKFPRIFFMGVILNWTNSSKAPQGTLRRLRWTWNTPTGASFHPFIKTPICQHCHFLSPTLFVFSFTLLFCRPLGSPRQWKVCDSPYLMIAWAV